MYQLDETTGWVAPLSQSAWRAFMDGDGRLPLPVVGQASIVEVLCRVEKRKVAYLHHACVMACPVTPEGLMDSAAFTLQLAVKIDVRMHGAELTPERLRILRGAPLSPEVLEQCRQNILLQLKPFESNTLRIYVDTPIGRYHAE